MTLNVAVTTDRCRPSAVLTITFTNSQFLQQIFMAHLLNRSPAGTSVRPKTVSRPVRRSMSAFLQVMTWVGSYQETCRELGIEESELEFPAGQGRGIAALVDCYTTRVHGLLNTWFTNILEVCNGLILLFMLTQG